MSKVSTPKAVAALVERFERDRKVFESGGYQEEQLRVESRTLTSRPRGCKARLDLSGVAGTVQQLRVER
ncbi:MAG: hypothetical protein ABIL25_08805 [candidate division WOR-3 bacterium]